MSSSAQFSHQPDPGLYNPDLAPVPKEKRNWSWLNYSTIWMGMVHNIVSYELAGSLIGLGMSAWQALAAVIVSNVVLIAAIWLNSICGTKYGLPFPVLIRAAFGYRGAHVPVLIRAFVAIFWFSVQAYAGSKAVGAVIGLIFPGWVSLGNIHLLGAGLNDLISFAIFWLVHAFVILHGMERIKHFELWAGPLVIVLGLGLVVWAIHAAHGLGPIFSIRATLPSTHFWGTFFLSVSGMIGVLASLVLNIPDLTRFAGSQRDQVIGQALGLPVMMTFFAFMSVVITSGTVIAFGKPIFDPVQLLLHFKNPIVVFLGAFSLLIATVSVNVVANVVSPAYDLTNLLPKKLNFVKGGIISILIGVLFAPWAWYNNSNSILTVIGAIGGTLGPVAGIMIADFYFIRRRNYDVDSLFSKEGVYAFRQGWNPRAFIAMILGIIVALIGLFVPGLHALYAYNWFLGIGVGALAYIGLMLPVRGGTQSYAAVPAASMSHVEPRLESVSLQHDET